jgi:hypothetical protein
MVWIVPGISSFRLVAPPLQPEVVGPFPGTRCMVHQPFDARGNRSYPEFWVVTGGPRYLRYITPTIFKHKFNSDGTLEWYKGRWVLRGFTQWPGIDYNETFNPVVKPATVRTVLSLTVSRSWPLHQLDVKNTFLHGTLSETVYCSQPIGFLDPTQLDWVCRLNKSLYKLKQASRTRYNQFTMDLLTLGFVDAKSDTSLYVFRCSVDMIYLLLYVDNIVLTASSRALLQHTISTLRWEFAMNDLSPLHHFFGVSVQH